MPLTFGFFSDAGLTTPVTTWSPVESVDGSQVAADYRVYFGSPDATKKAQNSASPGVGAIEVSIADSLPAGGQPASSIKLATTQAGLATATGGAPLSLGTQVLGGSGNAISVWARIRAGVHVGGLYTDLSLTCTEIVEGPV